MRLRRNLKGLLLLLPSIGLLLDVGAGLSHSIEYSLDRRTVQFDSGEAEEQRLCTYRSWVVFLGV